VPLKPAEYKPTSTQTPNILNDAYTRDGAPRPAGSPPAQSASPPGAGAATAPKGGTPAAAPAAPRPAAPTAAQRQLESLNLHDGQYTQVPNSDLRIYKTGETAINGDPQYAIIKGGDMKTGTWLQGGSASDITRDMPAWTNTNSTGPSQQSVNDF